MKKAGRYLAGELHSHTHLTDGRHTQEELLVKAFDDYHLDFYINAEHGGTTKKTPFGRELVKPIPRWQSLKTSLQIINYMRMKYEDKILLQGLEWNVPGHEHMGMAIYEDEENSMSDFEYIFGRGNEKDTSRLNEGLLKFNKTHEDAVRGAKFLQDRYSGKSYLFFNHPSRALIYPIHQMRDFNNVAPDVCFGFEGMPGYQKKPIRGHYYIEHGKELNYKARTYGGADYMLAKIGGGWDALLGEGRRFFVYQGCDFHHERSSFWPGEYTKTYVYTDEHSELGLIDGIRSGNVYIVQGDLIKTLEFTISYYNKEATMGEEITVSNGANVTIALRYKSPEINNNGDRVKVDHIDLIMGEVTEIREPGTEAYNQDINPTAEIIKIFTNKDWTLDDDGFYSMTYTFEATKNQYFRLRGTNQRIGDSSYLDQEGNPKMDPFNESTEKMAWENLWFYSNPIFLHVE
ncbi:CehA/McbA family metallohydrolase domain-containing protein [Vallitalea okinawensis]|uniref:hypothetical protein n=1 Tax=Vallitalea okinawensis TaxID=2078660 RepID=UPI000CFAB928|nr:hypothetical protein [Vallitalea okinawensis]